MGGVADPVSQFLWLKNPGGLGADGSGFSDWEQNMLIEGGPDVFIEFIYLEAEGVTYEVLVTSEYRTRDLPIVEEATCDARICSN